MELLNYILWDYIFLVIFVTETIKRLLSTLPRWKGYTKEQQRETKKWIAFILAGLIAAAYYKVNRTALSSLSHADWLSWQIKLLINYFASTSVYELIFKYVFKSFTRNSDAD